MKKILVTEANTDKAVTVAREKLNTTYENLEYRVLEHTRKSSTIEAWVFETKKLEQLKIRKCPDCGKEISRKAESCPHCGRPIEKTITCHRCEYDTDLTYRQIQDLGYSVICKNCGTEVRVSTPEVEARWAMQRENEAKAVECPYCHSKNTSKISTTAKAVNVALFGLLGNKRKHQWHCNSCKSDF